MSGPRCEAILRGINCADDAVTWLTIGCVHEHIDRVAVCASDLLAARVEIGLERFWCTPCEESRQPHECRIYELREERLARTRELAS